MTHADQEIRVIQAFAAIVGRDPDDEDRRWHRYIPTRCDGRLEAIAS